MSGQAETSAAFSLLLAHLEQQERAGTAHVWLSPEARAVMRAWHQAQRPARGPSAGAARAASSAPPAFQKTAPAEPAAAAFSLSATSPAPPAAAPASISQLFAQPSDSDRPARLEALQRELAACPHYRALIDRHALRETMVFAVGNPHSPLVFVGEAPGAEEEKEREPFVGPAGQLLTKIIGVMGLQRSQVYITNIVKYRPSTSDAQQGSRNRAPTPEEIAAGLPWLRRELGIIAPRVIVALGGTAIQGLLGEGLTVGKARGRFHDFDGIPVMPTFHPSYLLRNESLTERRKVWEDLLQVMEKLGLPISPKQRAYFKV